MKFIKSVEGVGGLTLMEFIISVTIISLLACISGLALKSGGIIRSKTYIRAHQIAADMRLARTLAIVNSSVNDKGYAVEFLGSGGSSSTYKQYMLMNLKDNTMVGMVKDIDPGHPDAPAISCYSSNLSQKFTFLPFGNVVVTKANGDVVQGSGSLSLIGKGSRYDITVWLATGRVELKKSG